MTERLIALFSAVPVNWRVFFLAAIPVTELRAAIPLGLAWGVSPGENLLYAVLGNMLPVIPLLLLLEPVVKLLTQIPFFARIFAKLFARTRRHSEKIEKYGAIGLAIFVGVPAPGTGAWTGALLAFLFGIRFWYAFPAIAAGVLGAGIIVTIASLGIWQLAQKGTEYLIGAVLALSVWYIWRRLRK
ncbi:COG2426 family protein [Zhaonella formicivorans]|uniref:COG2426 family protein n=1 Tax=Zhaonella formicivorans TaxID=2528593 RepID=UPI0010E1A219|nr:small multi-drug export protein [Zhaonella formicivorans]